MLDIGRASGDEDRREHWSIPGMQSVRVGGVSLWPSAQDTKYLESGGLRLATPSLKFFCNLIRLEIVSTPRPGQC